MEDMSKTHPYVVVDKLMKKYNKMTFYYSSYKYKPHTLDDERTIYRVESDDLSYRWVDDKIKHLAYGEELTLHSLVLIDNKSYHIPMMDLVGKYDSTMLCNTIRNTIPEFSDMLLFDSGRSYHVYSTTLIDSSLWQNFMFRCLLVNTPDGIDIADSRYVAHRLLAGYSTLRFSCNSKQYIKIPELVSSFSY